MNQMTTATALMTVRDILPGNPAALLMDQETRYGAGKRIFTMKVSVPDTGIYQQICDSVRKGDQIKATIAIDWTDDDTNRSLIAFEIVTPALAVSAS